LFLNFGENRKKQHVPMSRLFFALWPDEKIRSAIDKLSRQLKVNGGRPVSRDNYHVTLVFLGNVETANITAIVDQTNQIKAQPFDLAFDKIDYWRKPKTACITAQQCPKPAVLLTDELAAIARLNGLPIDPRPFCPHITLMRKAPAFSAFTIEALSWRAESFCLVESMPSKEGSRYTLSAKWSLGVSAG
jgi:2'-5' RNA ligase